MYFVKFFISSVFVLQQVNASCTHRIGELCNDNSDCCGGFTGCNKYGKCARFNAFAYDDKKDRKGSFVRSAADRNTPCTDNLCTTCCLKSNDRSDDSLCYGYSLEESFKKVGCPINDGVEDHLFCKKCLCFK